VTLCLDTNAYAAFKRGHEQIKSLLEAAEEVVVPTNDAWIAATAMDVGARILSLDTHFARIPAVICIPVDPV